MGVLLSVLPGDIVLHAQMAVETLGGRENPGSHDGPGRGHMHGSGEEAEEEDPARLPVGEPAVPQLVDLQILPVRNDGVNERCGSNVHDESFLRRRVPHVRRGRDPFFGERPGRPSGPDDFHISQDDEVHLPQVRRVRRGGDARLHMHTAVERRQREDLRFPVVLVHDPRRIIGGRTRIQVRHNRVAADARVPVRRAVPADQTAGDRQHRAPVQARRLDAVVRARRQRRLGRVPGRRARSVAPAGVVPQQELDGGEDGGRVTRKPLSSGCSNPAEPDRENHSRAARGVRPRRGLPFSGWRLGSRVVPVFPVRQRRSAYTLDRTRRSPRGGQYRAKA